VWRDNGTLTFPEVNSGLCIRMALLQAAASRAIHTTWRQSKLKNHPSDGSYRMDGKCLTPLLSHSRNGSGSLFESLPAGEVSPAICCFYQ